VVTIDQADQPVIAGKAVGSAGIRLTPTRKAPKAAHLKDGEILRVYREDHGWLLVRTEAGRVGYVPKSGVAITGVIPGAGRKTPSFRPWTPLGDRINLVWEYVGNRTPKTIDIPDMPGLNVVSPTWFHVIDNEGNVSNTADTAYVRWAAERGYQVWGLVTNGFDRDRTRAVLSESAKREKVIRQLLSYAAIYDLDGINVDFENLYPEDKGLLVQFARELTPLAHEAGLVVSIDVTIKSQSKYWSLPYDRKALGEIVDYVALMAYDEHSKNGGKAGSVASLPWVEKGVKSLLEEVPADKILLGVPFYTRLWTEEKKPDGTVEVTAKAISMDAAKEWVKEADAPLTWDEAAGQAYAEKADGNKVMKVWLENEKSMAARVELVRKYNLVGLAAWRRGFEEEAIWTTINLGMQKGPR
jgi:spore germination protein YaaH